MEDAVRRDRPPSPQSSPVPALDGERATLALDAFGRLVLDMPGSGPLVGVVPVRCFPFSAPTQRITLCDPHGAEVACIEDLSRLPTPLRLLVEDELARREFLPVITRILEVSPGGEPSAWHVVTDRGRTRFVLASEDHVRRLGAEGLLITASDGVRFRVVDHKALDARSRKVLSRYL